MPIDDPKEQEIISVQDRAEAEMYSESPLVMHFAGLADGIPATVGLARDIALSKFWRSESMLQGAIYSMCAKVAALDYKLTGPRNAVSRYSRVLRNADFGAGWITFASKLSQDILTSDNGAFIELMRARGAGPTAPVLGIAALDSQRCVKTGNPRTPVHYADLNNDIHELKWYQVLSMVDMPSPREEDRGVGWCAVSRVLQAAQILRDVGIYKRQKLSGKRVPALLFVQGVRRGAIHEAIRRSQEEERQAGRSLYSGPIVISSPDPGAPLATDLVELAGLPDGYDEDTLFKWYIATLALGFGTDYTEFGPLPGGGLGTATQATEMAARSRGKGPGVILQQFEYGINSMVLPQNVEFQFSSTDPIAERERIQLRYERAKERSIRVQSGELTTEQALVLAIAEGDAPESFLDEAQDVGSDRVEHIVRELQDISEAFAKVNKVYGAKTRKRAS